MLRFLKLNRTKWVLLFILPAMLLVLGLPEPSLGEFAMRISPPNFEFKVKPGQIIRDTVLLENTDINRGTYTFRTADWDLNENGGVVIYPVDQALASTSCRPWTRIERKTLSLAPNRSKRYRFEVHVPHDAPDGECRFAIVIGPSEDTTDAMNMGSLNVPVMGAIAVIVYATVGDAAADLSLEEAKRVKKGEEVATVLRLRNTGDAHARPLGSLMAQDATGKSAELMIVPFPVLPGEIRDIRLAVDSRISGIESMDALTFPISLKGMVEWDGGNMKIDTVVE